MNPFKPVVDWELFNRVCANSKSVDSKAQHNAQVLQVQLNVRLSITNLIAGSAEQDYVISLTQASATKK